MNRPHAHPAPSLTRLVALAIMTFFFIGAARAQQSPGAAPTPPRPEHMTSRSTTPLPPGAPDIEGLWQAVPEGGEIWVRHLGGLFYELESTAGWEGVGILDGVVFRGVLREKTGRATGNLVIDWSKPEPAAQITYTSVRAGSVDQRWTKVEQAGVSGSHPKIGEYVYVEELPEAITKVPPVYPDTARSERVQGTVMVQALVGKDGRVKDTRVLESIPQLDAAAVEAVRQWVFKPAQAKGSPVEIWVAIPVKFTLH